MPRLSRAVALHWLATTAAVAVILGLCGCGTTLDSLGSNDVGGKGGATPASGSDAGRLPLPPKFVGNITTNGAVRSDFKKYGTR